MLLDWKEQHFMNNPIKKIEQQQDYSWMSLRTPIHVSDAFGVPLGKITVKTRSIIEHYQEVCSQNSGFFNERKRRIQCNVTYKEDQIVELDLCKLRLHTCII